jgi:hypothetical protein
LPGQPRSTFLSLSLPDNSTGSAWFVLSAGGRTCSTSGGALEREIYKWFAQDRLLSFKVTGGNLQSCRSTSGLIRDKSSVSMEETVYSHS